MASLGIMFDVLRRQSGARRGRQRCRRDVAIETTVANCSRPSEPITAVSCAVGGAAVASRLLAKPDTAWVAVKSRGAPGSCVADDPPKRRSGRPGECRHRPCRRPQRPSQAASLCMWSYCVLV